MNPQTLLAWWNLIFVVPFGLALLYLGVYAATGIGVGEVDADADVDADVEVDHDVDVETDVDVDHDVDADADIDADADVDADHDLEADHDADADSDADGSGDGDGDTDHDAAGSSAPVHAAVLGFLGVGHVPVGFLMVASLMTWGTAGFIVNQFLVQRYGNGPRLVAVSAPAAAVASLLMLRTVVTVVRKWIPLNESSARRRHELLGSSGEALFAINETFGLAAVRDDRGELFQVPCRVEAGAAALPKGARVLLVGYSGSNKSFYVRPVESVAAVRT